MTSTNDKPEKKKRSPLQHSPQDKVQAVLAVWTDRCKPAEVCRQLNISWITLHYWQRRALEGMLQALESRVNLLKGEALSPRLQHLLQHQLQRQSLTRLAGRLKQVQQKKIASNPADPAKTG
jgi:transposase-like protein